MSCNPCCSAGHCLYGLFGQVSTHQWKKKFVRRRSYDQRRVLILFAFITGNSDLDSFLESLLAQIHIYLSSRGFGRNQTGHLRLAHHSVSPDLILPHSISYTHVYFVNIFAEIQFIWVFRSLQVTRPDPCQGSHREPHVQYVCVCAYTHTYTHVHSHPCQK